MMKKKIENDTNEFTNDKHITNYIILHRTSRRQIFHIIIISFFIEF